MATHEITRMRLEAVRRRLTVAAKRYVTPQMLEIVFQSDELNGFESPSPDDHIKVFFPVKSKDGETTVGRDFTPRAWDTQAGTLTLHFAVHAGGPAIDWALRCNIGDALTIGGPRGSSIVPDDFDWYLLIGDASALPSMIRRAETLREGAVVYTVALVAGPEERQHLATRATWLPHWVCGPRTITASASALRAELESLVVPAGDGYIWIAGEANISRELYSYATVERGHPAEWVKASTYWTGDAANG